MVKMVNVVCILLQLKKKDYLNSRYFKTLEANKPGLFLFVIGLF